MTLLHSNLQIETVGSLTWGAPLVRVWAQCYKKDLAQKIRV